MLRLFIGANNETGEVEVDKIRDILGKHFSGYTIINSLGCWNGGQEKSVVVEVQPTIDLEWTLNQIYTLVNELKSCLKQESIGVQQIIHPVTFI